MQTHLVKSQNNKSKARDGHNGFPLKGLKQQMFTLKETSSGHSHYDRSKGQRQVMINLIKQFGCLNLTNMLCA